MSEDFVLTEEGLQANYNDVKRSMVGGRRSVVTDTIVGHNDLVGGQWCIILLFLEWIQAL